MVRPEALDNRFDDVVVKELELAKVGAGVEERLQHLDVSHIRQSDLVVVAVLVVVIAMVVQMLLLLLLLLLLLSLLGDHGRRNAA